MLEDLRPCDAPLLIDMTDEDDRHALGLAVLQQGGGALAYLRDAPRGGVGELGLYGLYGVDDEDLWLGVDGGGEDLLEVRLGIDQAVIVCPADAVCTHLELGEALFARDVERLVWQAEDGLQDKGRLPDTWLPPEEDEGAFDEPATEDAVQLGIAETQTALAPLLDVPEAHGLAGGDALSGEGAGGFVLLADDDLLFFDRVPYATLGAEALPLGVLCATFGAVIDCFLLCHRIC